MTTCIPRTSLKEYYSKLLIFIQKYFTCEGMLSMVYQYHFKLLLHFIGKHPLDIPFHMFRSLGKMVDNVQAKLDANNTYVFLYGLIKLLVVEDFNRMNRYFLTFIFLSGFESNTATPRKNPKIRIHNP